MSITLDASPITTHSTKRIVYSNQTAVWSVSTDTTITDDFRYVVYIRENSASGTLLAKYYLPPNPEDKLHFNFNDTARGLVEHQLFNQDGNLLVDGDNFESTLIADSDDVGPRRIYIRFGEYTDAGGETSPDITQNFLLIPGARQDTEGLHPEPVGLMDSNFTNVVTDGGYLAARLPLQKDTNILTYRWDFDNDHIVLAFINDNVMLTAQRDLGSLRLRLRNNSSVVESAESSSGLGTQSSTSNYTRKIQYVQLNREKLEAIFTSDLDQVTWTHMEVIMRDASNNYLAQCNLYKHCYSKKHDHVQMAFTNWRGGYDYLWFNLKTQKDVQVSRKMYSRVTGSYGGSTFTLDTSGGEVRPYYVDGTDVYTLQMETPYLEEQQLLEHALRSKNVFIRLSEGWVPVVIDNTSVRAETESRTGLYRATLNVKRATSIKC